MIVRAPCSDFTSSIRRHQKSVGAQELFVKSPIKSASKNPPHYFPGKIKSPNPELNCVPPDDDAQTEFFAKEERGNRRMKISHPLVGPVRTC